VSNCDETRIISTGVWKILNYEIMMRIRPVTDFHIDLRTDGETDMTNLTIAFRGFAKAPRTAL